jgi:quercetin dioxygenase-like cupin family protein
MDTNLFLATLDREGFKEGITVTREPGGFADEHAHEFEAKALILNGELSIRSAAGETLYRVGDVFHLKAGEPHSERYGPAGVRYLVGRK